MDELDLDDPDLRAALDEDKDIDPSQPIADDPAAPDFKFPPRENTRTREDALSVLRSYVYSLGAGATFSPADIYGNDDLIESLGRGPSWVRGAMETLVKADVLSHDRVEGTYTVEPLRVALRPAV